jgi:hypothetical protein
MRFPYDSALPGSPCDFQQFLLYLFGHVLAGIVFVEQGLQSSSRFRACSTSPGKLPAPRGQLGDFKAAHFGKFLIYSASAFFLHVV